MFGITWVHESTFSTENVIKSKYRASIFDENLPPEWGVLCIKYTLGLEDLIQKNKITFKINYILKW